MKTFVYDAEKPLSKLTSGEPTCMEEVHVYNVYDTVGIWLLYFVAAMLNVDFICRIPDFWSAIAILIIGIFFYPNFSFMFFGSQRPSPSY